MHPLYAEQRTCGTMERMSNHTDTLPSICTASSQCGACSCIDEPYALQLAEKQARIRDLFEDLVDEDCLIYPIAGMDDPFRFRTKIASPFAPGPKMPAKRGGKQRRRILTGMYAAGTHKLVDTACCVVEHPAGQQVIRAIKQVMGKFGVEPYNEDTGRGFLRHAVVRVGWHSGEVLVVLVTNGREFTGAKGFAREVARHVPSITTVVQNVNTHRTNAILGTENHVLYGPGFILDTLCDLSFRISATSFYQVNPAQTEVLYRRAIELADLRPGDSVLDAYCGTGTIGLVAAKSAPDVRVIGVDKTPAAIRDAGQNAQHNGVGNAEFVAADAGAFMRERAAVGENIDVVLMDPPRSGASREFIEAVIALKPSRIAYISCNPETQARDVAQLQSGGYRCTAMQPVDMFPHTGHIENICSLEVR